MHLPSLRSGPRARTLGSSRARGVVALSVLLSLGGCASAPDGPVASPAAEGGGGLPAVTTPYEVLDPARFAHPTRIDNPWLPLEPGKRYVFKGSTVEDDGRLLPHEVIIHVTDLTKVVGGIRSVVTWDLDHAGGRLAEAELAFYAQDDDGNVWRMGEYPEEYDEDGKVLATPAWIHGYEDARAGIMMPARPATGLRSYAQGWGPKVGWTDRGKVDQTGLELTVPAGRYPDVIVISETAVSEPGAEQLKFYARGVGNVKVGWRGEGEKSKETLELVSVETMDAAALAEVRASAFKLEARAYQLSPDAYAHTPPMEPAAAGAGAAPTP